jgi:hypothetical protein
MKKNKTRTWVEWSVATVNEDDLCPGPVPAEIGGKPFDPGAQLTHAEFLVLAGKMHGHATCGHYKNESLGLELPESGMTEITGIDAQMITASDAEALKRNSSGGVDHPAIIKFRRDLHNYVDAIELRDGGKLHIPRNLLNLSTYLKEFFNVKEG